MHKVDFGKVRSKLLQAVVIPDLLTCSQHTYRYGVTTKACSAGEKVAHIVGNRPETLQVIGAPGYFPKWTSLALL